MAQVIHGDGQNNQLNARADKSQVYGLQGNDTLTSDGKSDVLLVGGSGNDSLIMTGGNGTLSGGEGSDTFELTYSADKKLSATIEDLDPANDKIIVNFNGNTAPQFTTVTSGNDVVLRDGDRLNVTVKGVRDNDYFDGTADDNAWKVLELTNAEREAQNLSALAMSDGLTEGAQIRAEEITKLGTLGLLTNHDRPDADGNPDPDKPYDTIFDDIGKHYSHYAENLDGGAATPQEVVAQWMSSDSHERNILNPIYQRLGVGYDYNDPDPTNHRWYWTQLFGDSLTTSETVDVSTANVATDTVSKFIQLTEDDDIRSNSEYGATIAALGGNDSINNSGLIVSISGGADNDTINNSGSFATINPGTGDDSISLGASAKEVLIQYATGDGADTISGLNASDTVSISGDEYTPAIVGNNVVVAVGTDSITLAGAASGGVQLLGARSKLIILTNDDDALINTIDGANIQALGGNDYIDNYGANVTLDSGAGNDSIDNSSANVTIDAGNDNDYVFNSGTNVSISGANGNDTVYNTSLGSGVTIDGGANNDYIANYGSQVTIDGGIGNDYIQNNAENVSISGNLGGDDIHNVASNVTITAGDGNDSVANVASNVTIDGGEYNDRIDSFDGANISIVGGLGNDSISNSVSGSNSTIDGGAGQDFIVNEAANVTINAGINNDRISLGATAQNNLLVYNSGDGNDVIAGLNETSTLRIGDGTGTYSKQTSGDNLIVTVGDGTITLRGAANLYFELEGTERDASDTTPAADRHIVLTQGGDTYRNSRDDVTIEATDGSDYYIINSGAGVSVSGANGKDSIGNTGTTVIINGKDGDDFLSNEGTNVAVFGGAGKDYIENIGPRTNIDAGDDDDTIYSGSDSVNIGCGAGDDSVYNDGVNTKIFGFAGNDSIVNRAQDVSIYGNAGEDFILNDSNNVMIYAGTDNDIISLGSGAQNVLILYNAGEGEDFVRGFNSDDTLSVLGEYSTQVSSDGNHIYVITGEGHRVILENAASLSPINIISRDEGGSTEFPLNLNNSTNNTLITGTAYGDTIGNTGAGVTIEALGGNDSINNYRSSDFTEISSVLGGSDGDSVLIDGGSGYDTVSNTGLSVTINGSAGNDSIVNYGANSSISGGADDDTIYSAGDNVSILGGTGADSIVNRSATVIIDGGAGNDVINNSGADVLITGGAGNDEISLSGDAANNLINYTLGDGNDIIYGYSANTTLNISGARYTTQYSGNDIVYNVGTGSITLKEARGKALPIIIGESGTSGGGSDSGGDGGGSSSGGGGRGGNDGGNTSGGTSSNEGNTSAASGGRSASGSSGSQTSSGISGSSGRVSTNRKNATASAASRNLYNEMTATNQPTQQTTAATTQNVYTGGNQVISNYQSGEKIIFGAQYTGAFYDAAGNFFAGSSTGALVIQNAMDKVIDLSDAAGNDFVKAYAASTAGVIDGRNIAGFELINGSSGADWIYAGDGGSQMWGGADVATDILVGGGGADIFIGGRTQGADLIVNASSADTVHFNDASLSDIIATEENNGVVAVAFNTGNVIAVQSSESLSSTFLLNDGSAYRYNHANKSWQSA